MPQPDIDVSIVTVSHGHWPELEQHVPGWLAGAAARELIVVDNTGRDGTAEGVRARFPGATVLVNERPLGFAANCNAGIARSRGRSVLLLNPDVRVEPGAIDRLRAYLDAHPRAGIVGPRLLNPDGSLQLSCRRFSTPVLFALRGLGLERALERHPAQRRALMQDWTHDAPRDVDWVFGAAMLVRREAMADAGPLDPAFRLYCEDQEWCHRMWAHGWEVHYVPDATMVHAHRRSSRSWLGPWKWVHARSMLRMFRKQGLSGTRPAPRAAAPARAGTTPASAVEPH